MQKLFWPVLLFLSGVAILSVAVWWWAYGTALDRLSVRGQTELSLASDRLLGQLQRFRQLAVVLSDHPALISVLSQGGARVAAGADSLLLKVADKTGSYEIFVLSASGRKVASSRALAGRRDYSAAPYFRRAMYGALGTAQRQIDEQSGRAFYFAAPLFGPGRSPIGALVVKVDIESVETDWRGDPNILFFTDGYGVVFVSNRSKLLFRSRRNIAALRHDKAVMRKYDPAVLRPFPAFWQQMRGSHRIWHSDDNGLFPARALDLSKPLPVIALAASILIDVAPARQSALLQAAFAAAVGLVFGAVLLILSQRRLALAEKLGMEERANHLLEERVARRTAQLSGMNEDLRRQVHDRIEAEDALKKAQQDLVQAGKLSALGQMSAGISHELNQPLMAIRSYAENATQYLSRGDSVTAGKNLDRISDLARRMGRIIKNLRTFTRKEGEPLSDIDIAEVVDAALELTEKQLRQAKVSLSWQAPTTPVLVRGGEVRLQQVLVNLVSNAIDAMDGQAHKSLEITVRRQAGRVFLSVRDSGPGLDDPSKIFDPFYTTKTVGRSEGMGLGLSISYGIVQSFGGRITGRNHDGGGAVFSMELNAAQPKKRGDHHESPE